jgi:Protein of unknown function (DUF551)
MNKTPEELAEEWIEINGWNTEPFRDEYTIEFKKQGYVAGYQAAKNEYKIAIDAYTDVAKLMLEEAVRIMTPTHEIAEDVLADANKVMPDTCEHIFDMSKMVDVSSSETLNNSSNNSNGWISVKDRLPEDGTGWLTVYGSIPNLRFFVGPGYYDYAKKEWLSRFLNYRARTDAANLVTDQIEYLPFEQVTHWMPLPKPPEEK